MNVNMCWFCKSRSGKSWVNKVEYLGHPSSSRVDENVTNEGTCS